MGNLQIIIIAFGLALDAFAVSVAAGAGNRINNHRGAFRLSFHFGLFQFLMPVVGWFAGLSLEPYVRKIDHWIAFFLLSYVAIKMMKESFSDEEGEKYDPSKGKRMVMLSIATSIDALVIGFSLAILNIDIWYPGFIIGVITASLSIFGIYFGKMLGIKFGKKMELLGGAVLIIIGLNILYSHLFHSSLTIAIRP